MPICTVLRQTADVMTAFIGEPASNKLRALTTDSPHSRPHDFLHAMNPRGERDTTSTGELPPSGRQSRTPTAAPRAHRITGNRRAPQHPYPQYIPRAVSIALVTWIPVLDGHLPS